MNLTPTREDGRLIRRIIGRVKKHHPQILSSPSDSLTLEMDLIATHLNGCPLRLRDLLEADDWNFLHDIGGIAMHVERRTGELLDRFMPRYAEFPHYPEIR